MTIEDPSVASKDPQARGLAAAAAPLALAGGLWMLAVACLVVVSVLRRWITGYEIQGVFEIVQISTALAVFAFLPYSQARRGNVMVDTFTNKLPKRLQAAIDAFWAIVYAAAAFLIAWRLSAGARDTLASGTTSMVLELPIGYAMAGCAAMAAILGLVALASAVGLLKERG